MANTPQSADNGDLQFQRDIDEVFSRANPNPNRVGCPPKETLVRLARREQPIGDPAYEHLAKCSPCFKEFRALQAQFANTVAVPRRPNRRLMVAGLAASLALAVAAGWRFTRDVGSPPSPQNALTTSSTDLRAEVDLRRFTVLRSEQAPTDVEPVSLPAGIVDLTLLLPVGSEPGTYDVQVLDSDLRSQTDATGTGAIENFVTTLRVRADLGRLRPGRYHLAVRRQGDSWRMFPAVVK
jgi:hypothetical protein